MTKLCVICAEVATKTDYNNNRYCNKHIELSNTKEKKIKRFHLDDEIYWNGVKKAACKNMDFRSYIIDLINRDFETAG